METIKTMLLMTLTTLITCVKVGLTSKGFKQEVLLINKIKTMLFFIYDCGVNDAKVYRKRTGRTDNGYNLASFDEYMNRFDSIDKGILTETILLLKPNLNSIINGILSFDEDLKSFGDANEAYVRLINFNEQPLLNLGLTNNEILTLRYLPVNIYGLFGSEKYRYKTFKQLVTYFYNLLEK